MENDQVPTAKVELIQEVIQFPLDRRTGRIRQVATGVAKRTESQAGFYRHQVTEGLRRQLLNVGVQRSVAERQIEGFWRAVDRLNRKTSDGVADDD